MTVKELIQELSQIEDQETRVMTSGYEGGYNDVTFQLPAIYEMALDVNEEWYYGAHEPIDNIDRDSISNYTIVKTIII